MFYLKLFGGVSIEGPDGDVTGIAARRHPLALLALLALSHSRRLSRDKLIGYLWPESASSDARNLLNQSVHALRRALGAEAISSEGDELVLSQATVTCDVWSFEEALASGAAERAVDFYVGPFADGFFLAESNEFESWTGAERERLRRAYAKALEELAEAATARGGLESATEWWRNLIAEEPYNSNVTLRFMETLESAGDRAGAIREAEAHAERLLRDLDAAPNPAVLALAERMRTQPIDSGPARGAFELRSDPERSSAVPAEPLRPGASRRTWKRAAILGAGLALLAVASWTVIKMLQRDTHEVRRLAVLPLDNHTGDPRQDYFVAGMHEALLTKLAQIPALTVISRQSVVRYGDSEEPLPAIARALGVDALVEGSVFLVGDSVRITVQLVRAEPEEHLWAGDYYGELRNALALQGEVARAIAQAIDARVAPAVQARLAGRRTLVPEAQEAYLRGLYHLEWQATTVTAPRSERLEAGRTAVAYLEEAVALDPEWAAAHAKLALAYNFQAASADDRDTESEFYAKVKAEALRALELDEAEAQAHASLGMVLLGREWDWAGAEREMLRALELEPSFYNHWTYAIYLVAAGRHDDAIAHYRQAEERNPLSEQLKLQIASAYSCAGRHVEAIAQLERLRARLGDGVVGLRFSLGNEYLATGRHAEAIAELEAAVDLSDSAPVIVAGLAYAYARAGRLDEARALMPRLEQQGDGWVWYGPALYAALGETDRAVAAVEAAFDVEGRDWAPHFRCSWTYRELRNEPRVQEIVRRIGFPD
jgi:DNA-binding SARP family transcriptional activator/TolB-like protein